MSHLKIGKYYGEDMSKKTYFFGDVLEDGYKDITSIEMIISSSDFSNKDFLFTRDFLIDYVNTLDIKNITIKEKHLLCEYAVLSYDDISEFYGADKAIVLINDNDNKLIHSLNVRKKSIISIYENTLTKGEIDMLGLSINNLDTFDLDSVLLEIDKITYLNDNDKIIIKNILNGESQKGYSDDIYKIK
tara:strand:+ start:661 stop:1224 length:564 start_codon:yes stop_codon:yes gene_type:complete